MKAGEPYPELQPRFWYQPSLREEWDYDPRGQCIAPPPRRHRAGGGSWQRHPSLQGLRDFADPVLPLAAAAAPLRAGRIAPPAEPADPLAAPSHPGPGARGPGLRVVVPDPWAGANCGPTGAVQVGTLAGQCLWSLRYPAPPWAADTVGAAHPVGGPQRRDGGPADRAHPQAPDPAPRGGTAPRRSGVPGRLLHRKLKGVGKVWHSRPATRPARTRWRRSNRA